MKVIRLDHRKPSQPVPDWHECQKFLMDHGDIVRNCRQGAISEAAWKIWKEAYFRGLFDASKHDTP